MTEPGRTFREAWIAGVLKHFPGEPKAGYITPWEATPDWERQAAAAVEAQIQAFIAISDGHTRHLTREQKGRWVATCWITQIHKHIPEPKASYVAGWDDLPDWQKETDADIFEAVEAVLPAGQLSEGAAGVPSSGRASNDRYSSSVSSGTSPASSMRLVLHTSNPSSAPGG